MQLIGQGAALARLASHSEAPEAWGLGSGTWGGTV